MAEQPSLASAARSVGEAARTIERLRSDGWQVTDDLQAVQAVSSQRFNVAQDAIAAIGDLLPFALNCEVTSAQGFKLELAAGQFEVTDRPTDPGSHFADEFMDQSERAAGGDRSAALSLPGPWDCSLTVDLSSPLRRADAEFNWHVVRTVDVLRDALSGVPWWEAAQVLGTEGSPAVHVVLDTTGFIQSHAWLACNIESLSDGRPALAGLGELRRKRAAVRSATGLHSPADLPLPEDLLGTVSGDGWSALDAVLHSYAAACGWGWLGGRVEPDTSGAAATVAMFGFRPLNVTIPASGLTDAEAQAAVLALYRWTTNEESVDRVLAVRQVASLYDESTVLSQAQAISRGAEPIYRGLRSTAVEEVLRAQRDARSLALDAARRTADGVLAGTKAVAERTLAALAGLGAAALAKSTTTAPAGISERLAVAIAVFLVALAVWSVVVEGPTLNVPLASLSDDLKDVGDLLTDEMRSDIEALRSVVLARRRAIVARVAGPLAYLLVAGAALVYAHPYPHNLWKAVHLL